VLRIELEPADVAASRFAVSPVFEVVMLLVTLLASGDRTPLARRHADGLAAVRDDPAVQALVYLNGPGYGASFAAPPPGSMAQTIADDVAAIRGADPAVVRTEIAEVRALRRPSAAVAAVLDADRRADAIADAVLRAWAALVEPDWPRMRAVLERDVRFRAELLAAEGWGAALNGMHPRLSWAEGVVTVARMHDGAMVPAGRGLLLIPSVFVGDSVAVHNEEPWQPALIYPSRGAGLLLEETPAAADPLAPLLGRTRAGLLLALATPSSTTQLAALTGASLGATGDHLKVLLDAGLVSRARIARSVVYRRTPLGDALATAS
jgi:DNA-binding transcriptional ArsR family regulator